VEQQKKSFFRRHRWLLWLAGAAVIVLLAIGVVLGIVARRFEPYLRARIVQGLADHFHAHVELDGFHMAVNNIRQGEWGIWATGTGLRIWPPRPVNGQQALDIGSVSGSGSPLINLDEFSFHVPLRWEQTKTIHIAEVRLKGLRIHIPPRAAKSQTPVALPAAPPVRQAVQLNETTPSGQSISVLETETSDPVRPTIPPVVIDRIVCENAELTLATNKPGKLPMSFAIPHLTLTQITLSGPMHYIADVLNPKPKGMVHSEGSFGPWVTADPGMSAVAGSYTMDKADLGVFRGIAGIITSSGNYTGTLRDLAVTGTATVPDFRLTRFGNPVPLTTGFSARVDGTDGDTWLNQVNARLGGSQFTTAGQIVRLRLDPASATQQGAQDGHSIDLNVNIAQGRIEDFLKLASKSPTPILTGSVGAKAHLLIPPGPDAVEQRIRLDGAFQLNKARFTSDKIQGKIQQLSLRGQGKPEDLKSSDPTLVRSDMKGSFHMAHESVALPDLDYSVPGADIQLSGSYSLEGALNFTGTARMEATVSQMVGGWKGLLLKPADKFFNKDGAGTLVPITIKGTREAPEFSLDTSRMGWKGTRAENPATKQQ
jgi:hypothetical protein